MKQIYFKYEKYTKTLPVARIFGRMDISAFCSTSIVDEIANPYVLTEYDIHVLSRVLVSEIKRFLSVKDFRRLILSLLQQSLFWLLVGESQEENTGK